MQFHGPADKVGRVIERFASGDAAREVWNIGAITGAGFFVNHGET